MTGAEIAATVTPPPTPWIMRGRMSMGLFRVTRLPEGGAPPVPAGLTPVLCGHRVVALVRYLEGTLRYNELIIGRMARHGRKLAILVDYIWVDSRESVSGGRRIWGLPKELAEFSFSSDQVSIRDDHGEIATLRCDERPAWLPEVSLAMPGFGVRDGRLLFFVGRVRVRLRRSSLRIAALAPRFGALASTPRIGLDGAPFELNIGDARVLQ